VRLPDGLIRIDGEVSKVREPRVITIQPNLGAWLRAYPLERFPIIPPNLQHLRETAVEKFNLTHDLMRHTFVSMFVAQFRSLGEAALQAGNSEAIIRKHYLDLKSAAEAAQFFGILPQRQGALAATQSAQPRRLRFQLLCRHNTSCWRHPGATPPRPRNVASCGEPRGSSEATKPFDVVQVRSADAKRPPTA